MHLLLRTAAILGAALPLGMGTAPAASQGPLGWSDPITIAATSVAVPPAVAVTGARVHVFWLDRGGPTEVAGDLWHAVLSADGRPLMPPSRLRSNVDTRLAFPVAVPWGSRAAVAWMTRASGGAILEIVLLGADGMPLAMLRAHEVPREEAGRITLATSGADGPLHVAWSQFDRGERMIWYARVVSPDPVAAERGGLDLVVSAPVAVTSGDAPALMLDPHPLLLWWEAEGAGAFRLMIGDLSPAGLTSRRPLTGAIALVAPLPALPSHVGQTAVILIPTIERTFSTAGRVYAVNPVQAAAAPHRTPLLGRTSVADLAVTEGDGIAVAVWSQPTGRRQNSEIHSARLLGEEILEPPSRVTFSIPGSLKPAGAVISGHPAAVWLEVTGFGRFSVSFATSATPRRRLFLLDVAELDVYRPGPSLLFAFLTTLSILPIALLVAAVTLMAGAILVAVGQMLAAPFSRVDDLLGRRGVKMGALLVATGLIQLAARGLIPGHPHPLALAIPLASLGIPVVSWVSRQPAGAMTGLLAVSGTVLGAILVALFSWGAGQLSQF